MIAIFKKEFKGYFHSIIGFLYVAAILFFVSLYFLVYNLNYGYPILNYALSSSVFVFLIAMPILTMRTLSDERKQKTDQLLLTAPVSVGKIVLGKFLAMLAVFAIPVAFTCMFPVILNAFGEVSFTENYIAILAFFFYGALCIAVGLLISSFTESVVIAAVLSFAVLFVSYVMKGLCDFISKTGNLLTKILGYLDMYTRFSNLINGSLDLVAIFYFVSFTALVLFLTAQSIQKRRYSISAKKLSAGAYNIGLIVASIALWVILNMFADELPVNIREIDITSNSIFSISNETKDYLKSVDDDIDIYVLVNESGKDDTVDITLTKMAECNDRINLTYIDPVVNPKFYTQYSENPVESNSVIVVSNDKSKVITHSDLYVTEIDYQTYSQNITGYDAEGQVVSAIEYVTSDTTSKVYCLEGHGENKLDASFTDLISKKNMGYESINLLNYDSVPDDCICLIVNAPHKDINENDIEKIDSYISDGGTVVLVSAFTDDVLENVNSLAYKYGMNINEGIVMEGDKDYFYSNPTYLLPEINPSSMTAGIVNKFYVFAPISKGITLVDTSDDIEVSGILSTTDQSFLKTDIASIDSYNKNEEDIEGPFDVAAYAKKTNGDKEGKLIVFACDSIFTPNADTMVSGANSKLFANSIGSAQSEEGTLTIPAKDYSVATITIPQSKIVLIALISIVLIPLALLVTGFIVWNKRRKK